MLDGGGRDVKVKEDDGEKGPSSRPFLESS